MSHTNDGRNRTPPASPHAHDDKPAAAKAVADRASALPAGANFWRTEELLDQGLGRRLIGRLAAEGSLVRLHRGCYVRASFWSALTDDQQHRGRIEAYAHRTANTSTGRAVFSHTSAARLRALYLWEVDARIHVTVPFLPSATGHAQGVVPHTAILPAGEVVVLYGLRVTSLERTAVECCRILNHKQGLILMDHALRKGASRTAMDAACDRLAGAPGVVQLRRVLAAADPLSESPGETLCRDTLRRLRLPSPAAQFEVRTRLGRSRLDFAWPERRVALEFDGRTKYFAYQPTPEVLFQERRREKALTELGWTVLRIEWKDLFREQELKARIVAALAG